MAAFEYQAINAKGQTVKGTIESDTLKLARQQLKSNELTLLEIEEVHKIESSMDIHTIHLCNISIRYFFIFIQKAHFFKIHLCFVHIKL